MTAYILVQSCSIIYRLPCDPILPTLIAPARPRIDLTIDTGGIGEWIRGLRGDKEKEFEG